MLTIADPASEQSRKLFAHYVWNAGVYLSELLSEADVGGDWNVAGETVLELGAGEEVQDETVHGL